MIRKIEEEERKVQEFNFNHKVGDKVKLRKDNGAVIYATVWNPATMLVNKAVGWFEEVSGCYSLDNLIRP